MTLRGGGYGAASVADLADVSEAVPLREVASAAREAPVPCIRLFTERVLVDRGWGRDSDYEEIEAPLIALSFRYPGARLRSSDPEPRFFTSAGGAMALMERDRAAEAHAQRLLESFGATPLDCLDDYGIAPDVAADYVVRVDGDAHAYCAFSTYALPRLRALGWQVEVDDRYRYQVVEEDVPWYASVEASEEEPDWFNLELGVEIDGRRINLLPILLDLLDNARGQKTLGALERASTRFFALPVGDTRYLPVAPDRMKVLVRVLVELYEGEGGRGTHHIAFPGRQASVLEQLDLAFAEDELAWEGETEVRQRGRRIAKAPTTSADRPKGLQATLRPYQEEGLAWLQHMRACGVGGVLADDMGLGKTLQTIAHFVTEKSHGRLVHPALVVAPTSLVFNWEREIRKFAPHLDVVVLQGPSRHDRWTRVPRADVVLTSYPLLVRDEERFSGQPFQVLVLDEAQNIKNVRSQAHKAVRTIDAEHKLCLTGTPLENNLGELWALFDFLNPGLLGDERRFRAWYRHPIERSGDEERLVALQQLVAPYILRRIKRDVAKDLPPKTELMRPVELTGKQRELYESIRVAAHAQVRQAIKKKGFVASTVSILDALMKLRQVCCDPRLVRMDAARFVRESAKYQFLFELLEEQLAGGHRVLVFSQFTSMLALVARGLSERSIGYVALTGSTQRRHEVVDAFEGGAADVFLISLKAGGTGLTLTSADTVIHYDPWWNPAAQAQATDRAYRIGQTKPVFVHNLFVAGSVEERMLRLQQRKQKLASAVLGQGPGPGTLTEDDVDALFAPLDD